MFEPLLEYAQIMAQSALWLGAGIALSAAVVGAVKLLATAAKWVIEKA